MNRRRTALLRRTAVAFPQSAGVAFVRRSGLRDAAAALGFASCIATGCGVERTVAVERIDGPNDAGSTGVEASIDGTVDARSEPTDDASAREGGPDAGATSSCENPTFRTSMPIDGTHSDGYYVYNNVYDTTDAPGLQTLFVCSYRSWYVVSDQNSDAGAVGSYPNVQMNFNDIPVSSLQVLSSTFDETSPRVGVYEDAYDIWLNGIDVPGSTQVLIWVDNFGRVPDGTLMMTKTLGDRTYDVYLASDNLHIVFESIATFTSGTVDLLQILDWTIQENWLSSSAVLNQIDFGVEIESTGGVSATYQVNDFSITTM